MHHVRKRRVAQKTQTVGTRYGNGSFKNMPKKIQEETFKPPDDLGSIKTIADEWLKWSEDPNAMVLQEYPLSKRWNPYHFYHLSDKSEYFANVQTMVKERIALRIEEQSRSGRSDQKIDSGWVKEFLPAYSEAYKKRRTELVSAKIDGYKSQPIQVIIPPILLPEDKD